MKTKQVVLDSLEGVSRHDYQVQCHPICHRPTGCPIMRISINRTSHWKIYVPFVWGDQWLFHFDRPNLPLPLDPWAQDMLPICNGSGDIEDDGEDDDIPSYPWSGRRTSYLPGLASWRAHIAVWQRCMTIFARKLSMSRRLLESYRASVVMGAWIGMLFISCRLIVVVSLHVAGLAWYITGAREKRRVLIYRSLSSVLS